MTSGSFSRAYHCRTYVKSIRRAGEESIDVPMTLRAGELMVNPLFAGTIEGAVRDEAGEPPGEVVVVDRMRTLAERQGLLVARVRSRPTRHRPREDSPASSLASNDGDERHVWCRC